MEDTEEDLQKFSVLLESEVAERLRCSISRVKRLRLTRRLAYLPGRPATVVKEDVAAYVASAKLHIKRIGKKPLKFATVPANAKSRPFRLLTFGEAGQKYELSIKQIHTLCKKEGVPFIRARPPLIDDVDLIEHFEKKRIAKLAVTPGTAEFELARRLALYSKIKHRIFARTLRKTIRRLYGSTEGDV